MDTGRKIKILSWLVAALIILTLSTLITVIYRLNKVSAEPDEIGIDLDSVVMTGVNFRQVLQLTPQQTDEFRELNREFRFNARQINYSLDRARIQMFDELQKKNPDMKKCSLLSAEIGRLHEELKMETCKFYIEMKHICNDEQEEKLRDLFDPVFRVNLDPGYGRGRGYGYGGGARFRWGQRNVPSR